MAKIETYFDCDLKKAVQVQPLNGNVFSLDNNGNRIGVRIFDNGVKTTVTGTVTGRAILADNSTVTLNGGLTTVNGQSVAYVDVQQGALLIPGTIKITIQLTASGVITTLAAILSTVYQTKTDNVITPSAQVIADWNAEISSAIQTQNATIASAIATQDAQISDLKSALGNIAKFSGSTRDTYRFDYPLTNGTTYVLYVMSGNIQTVFGRTGSDTPHMYIANATLLAGYRFEFTATANDAQLGVYFYTTDGGEFAVYEKGESSIMIELEALEGATFTKNGAYEGSTRDTYRYDYPLVSGKTYRLYVEAGSIQTVYGRTGSGTAHIYHSGSFLVKGDEIEFTATADDAQLFVYYSSTSGGKFIVWEKNGTVQDSAFQNSVDIESILNPCEIICIGDSQTANGEYAMALQNNITDDKSVQFFGQSGANSVNVIATQGGISLYVKPFTIPAATTAVEIELYNDWYDFSESELGKLGTNGINPVIINGVEGTITITNNSNVYKSWFTRSAEGTAVTVDRPCAVSTMLSRKQRYVLVIWLGTNDSGGDFTAATLAEWLTKNFRNAISYNQNEDYIILGLTAKSIFSDVEAVNVELAKNFGSHFLDIRKYILEYGIDDASEIPGYESDPSDETDIANNEIPRSLRKPNDTVHFNNYGYTVIGNLLYKKGVSLGYWK